MKLGSIVGIICSCILIIAGIILCYKGISVAEENNQTLFTQKNKDGTYYCQQISDEITRIDLNFDQVSVTVSEGAETSCIEFYNFNPNNYVLTATTNVISFEETPEYEKITDIFDNGINFKGLRYALDPDNYTYKSNDKRVVVNLADELDIKILDISADNGSINISSVNSDSDISLSLNKGTVNLSDIVTSSTIEILGGKCNADINNTSALSFKFKADESEIKVNSSSFSDTNLTVNDGIVDYNVVDSIEKTYIEATSEGGTILVNSAASQSPYKLDIKEYDKSVKIKTVSANINLTHPIIEAPADTEAVDVHQ